MKSASLFNLIAVAGLMICGQVSAANDQLLYVIDIVNHGSALPTNYFNATGVQHPYTGAGMVTPFGMRQMHIRGREMRSRYVKDKPLLDQVSNPKQFFAYSIDGDRTYSSALSFFTGLYPGGTDGPANLF